MRTTIVSETGKWPQRDALISIYRDGLLNDTLPFWLNHAIDEEHGGYLHCLDRTGQLIDTDKSMWIHGRFIWLLSTLYADVEARPEWLQAAEHGIQFMRRCGFDEDGRMFFQVTQEGKPLVKRRYIFTETFGVIALAAYARATGDSRAAEEARQLFELILKLLRTPGLLPPKVDPQTRQSKALGVPMILLATAQVLRDMDPDPLYLASIDRSIAEIRDDFIHDEFEAVLETVTPEGEFSDSLQGRMLNPGHSIEAAWFVLHEARVRNKDAELLQLGLKLLDWSWNWGWDTEYGGMIYYRDVRNLPPTEYWHDMKFWWPQNEAIIANLLAWQLTNDEKYAHRHKQAHEWAYARFPDPEFGEWYGYLHRDGRISTTLKGNMWKGPFHLPRMQLYCWQLLAGSSAQQSTRRM